MGWPGRDLGRAVNRATWRLFAAGSGVLMGDRTANRYRASLGGVPVRGNALLGWTSAARTVSLLSRHYAGDEPDDWDGCQMVGFSHFQPAVPLDPAVDAFLDDGEPPVLVCLGDRDFAGPPEPLVEALPDARLKVLRGVDHFATPKDFGFIDAALSFLDAVPR